MRTLKIQKIFIFTLIATMTIISSAITGRAFTIDQNGVIEIECVAGEKPQIYGKTYFYPPTNRTSTLLSRGNHELFLKTHQVNWPILTGIKIYQYQNNEWKLVQQIAKINFDDLAMREDMDSTRFGINAEENIALGKCLESEFNKAINEYKKLYKK